MNFRRQYPEMFLDFDRDAAMRVHPRIKNCGYNHSLQNNKQTNKYM